MPKMREVALEQLVNKQYATMRQQADRINELESENAKLRELVQSLYGFSFDEYPDGTELNFADDLRELRIEVDE